MPKVMEITTPLGDDVLLFHGMHAREEMGRLSEIHIKLSRGESRSVELDFPPAPREPETPGHEPPRRTSGASRGSACRSPRRRH